MSYIIAILVFGLLIFVHELGHFVVAKLSGITVLQFTIGFGPAIFKKQIGETLYAVRLLPLGGAVMMQGEEDEEAEKLLTGEKEFQIDEASLPPEGSFAEASLPKRFAVSVAGAAMNFLTGVVIVFLLLLPARYASMPVISGFIDGFPYAAEDNGGVGFEVGDRIVRVNDFHVFTMSDFSTAMMYDDDARYDITVKRDGKNVRLEDFEMKATVPDPDGGEGLLYGFNLTAQPLTFFGKIGYAFKSRGACPNRSDLVKARNFCKKRLFPFFSFGFIEFITFGKGNYKRNFVIDHEINHMNVVFCRSMTAVDKLDNKANVSVTHKISFNKISPTFLVVLRNFCITVTGKVNKLNSINIIKVYGNGFSRLT